MKLEPVIGLEIHVQLKTKSKMFCGCDTNLEYAKPNSAICPICMGQPGTLPVVNHTAINFAHRICLALNFKINKYTKFDRKNYFYPDLPKGYQISQYELPMGENGYLPMVIKGEEKKIAIERIHLEEDTGKLIHPKDLDYSLVDYNRAGTPLCEIVTKPEISSPAEAKKFMQELQLLMRYLEVSDAEMENGQMRCDGNISLRPIGEDKLYPKTEIKNLNSFKALEKALEYEIKRQTEIWERGAIPGRVVTKEIKLPLTYAIKGQKEIITDQQETMGWDENKNQTVLQRVKETLADYRYFPEPDIPPMEFSDADLKRIEKSQIPELPWQKRKRFRDQFGLVGDETEVLIQNESLANYTENVISELVSWLSSTSEIEGTTEEIWERDGGKISKMALSWVVNRLKVALDNQGIDLNNSKVGPENMAELITLVYGSRINSTTAQKILDIMVENGGDPSQIIEAGDLNQVSDKKDLSTIIDQVIAKNPEQVKEYQAGKLPLLKYFVGQTMKLSKGKADPQVIEELLIERLR
ncbi:MAG: Asp-tRNA(Asn)/Glu-tRNA(Gln) amidotransferase subunit GatB [Patescibacteria group bacterium]